MGGACHQVNKARHADKSFRDAGLETFPWSNYYFYLTVIKNRADKNLKSRALSYARQSRSPWLVVNASTLFVGLALLIAASIASPVHGSDASPELVIENTRRDYGEVFVGEELDQIFTVRNVGTSPLELGVKPLTGRAASAEQDRAISASSVGRLDRLSDYLKPAAMIKRLAAPT